MLKTIFLLSAILLSQSLCAQTTSNSNPAEDEVITRTLRIIIAGNRRLPEFKRINGEVMEVDPPLAKLPPTSFQFADPKQAPKSKEGRATKTRYSAWPNKLITIENYTGPAELQLELRRPLAPKYKNQPVKCNLGNSTNPLIVIHPSSSSRGWKTPVLKVINIAKPTVKREATMVNLTGLRIQAKFFEKRTVLKGHSNKNIAIPTTNKNANIVKYKIQAYDPKVKQSVIVANSSYRMKRKTKLVIITMPGLKTSKVKIVKPNMSIIPITFK